MKSKMEIRTYVNSEIRQVSNLVGSIEYLDIKSIDIQYDSMSQATKLSVVLNRGCKKLSKEAEAKLLTMVVNNVLVEDSSLEIKQYTLSRDGKTKLIHSNYYSSLGVLLESTDYNELIGAS